MDQVSGNAFKLSAIDASTKEPQSSTPDNDTPEESNSSQDDSTNPLESSVAGALSALTENMPDNTTLENLSELLASVPSSLPDEEPSDNNDIPAQGSDQLEELADDMLVLMRRIREIEQQQQQILGRLDSITQAQASATRTVAMEVDTLRRELLGERRHAAISDLFGELMPISNRLQTMRENLDQETDERMLTQLNGVIDTISGCLRRMGIDEFSVEPGTSFDHQLMIATDAVAGPGDRVVATHEPGMKCGQLILRRATVQLDSKSPETPTGSGDETDE